MPLITKLHHTQLPATPLLAVRPATASGVSTANVVATIEVPASHHGRARPERKNSLMLRPARRVYARPTAAESAKYAATMIQSSGCMVPRLRSVGKPQWPGNRPISDGELHCVCDGTAQRHVALVFARRIDPIHQQNDEKVILRIDPDAGAGEAGMAERTR